jgi:drug/metabolite transporter (DMT)-like permease
MSTLWLKAIMIFGALVLFIGVVSAYFRTVTQPKFADLTSGNPNWTRPTPTSFDVFILGFPVRAVMVAGAALIIAGYVLKLFK